MNRRLNFLLVLLFLIFSTSIFADSTVDITNPGGVAQPSVITKMAVLAGLALLPFAIMLLTSFLKFAVVLSLLRNAIGVQQTPPNQAINGIALLMTVYVMFPTGLLMYQEGKAAIDNQPPQALFSDEAAFYMLNVVNATKEPLRDFLIKNTSSKHIKYFYQLAYNKFPEQFKAALQPTDYLVVVPAFILSQIKSAFEVGVLIYLPFFIIDLVTSNILLAMGMMMLSPLTIALPLKLLLLVMVDGWTLIVQGLTLSFR